MDFLSNHTLSFLVSGEKKTESIVPPIRMILVQYGRDVYSIVDGGHESTLRSVSQKVTELSTLGKLRVLKTQGSNWP